MRETDASAVPERFGPYVIGRLLGRGGMGQVHYAYDTVREREVALKRLRPAALTGDPLVSGAARARFRREARLAGQLREPHVLPVHDFGEIDGQLFLDTRLVDDGCDLAQLLAERGRLPAPAMVGVVCQVAAALDAAHAAGLVHRDVKPANVLVTGSDDDWFCYLTDFGIAALTADPVATAAGATKTVLTGPGMLLGSPHYMAPELFAGDPATAASDVYALAVMAYELLFGELPFTAESLPALMWAHAQAPVPTAGPSPDTGAGHDRFNDVLAAGMAKDPGRRPGRASEFADALRSAALAGGAPPAPPTIAERPSSSPAPAAGLQREHPAQGPATRPPGRPEPSGPSRPAGSRESVESPPRLPAARHRAPAQPADPGPDLAAAVSAPAAASPRAAAAVRRRAGWFAGWRAGSDQPARRPPPPVAVQVSGGLWCALAAAAFIWLAVDIAGGVAGGDGMTADNEDTLVLAVLLGGPPLCAPLLFRRGQGRVLVAVCAGLATWAGFWARGRLLGYTGALPLPSDVVWFAHAVPFGAAVAAAALLCSATPAGFAFFRAGPACYDPDCDGSDCPAQLLFGPPSARRRAARF